MYKYLASAWVEAPCDEVFAHYCDPANWQPTLPSLIGLEMLNDPPFGLGTRWRQLRRVLWMAQESEAEVVGYEPPSQIECRIHLAKLAEAGGTLQVAHHMAEESRGTRWTVGASLEMPEPMPRLVAWTVYAPMRWSTRRDLAAFKKAIERGKRNMADQA